MIRARGWLAPLPLQATRIERDPGFPNAAGILFPLAPLYLRIVELAGEVGDTATAGHYDRALLELWAEADPALRARWSGLGSS